MSKNAKQQLKKIQTKKMAESSAVYEEQQDSSERLYEFVSDYIKKLKISCPESIHQSDELNLDAPHFMESCCEIVGFYKD